MIETIKNLFGGSKFSESQIVSYFEEKEGFSPTSSMIKSGIKSASEDRATLDTIIDCMVNENIEEYIELKTIVSFEKKENRKPTSDELAKLKAQIPLMKYDYKRNSDYDNNVFFNNLIMLMLFIDLADATSVSANTSVDSSYFQSRKSEDEDDAPLFASSAMVDDVETGSGSSETVAGSFDMDDFDSYVADTIKTETSSSYDSGTSSSSYDSSGSGSGTGSGSGSGSGDSSGSGSGSGSGCSGSGCGS